MTSCNLSNLLQVLIIGILSKFMIRMKFKMILYNVCSKVVLLKTSLYVNFITIAQNLNLDKNLA